jgi:hypothetical protein
MKLKILVTVVAVACAGIQTFGQGTIKFNNRLTGQVDAPISLFNGQGAGSIPGVMAQLYFIPATGAPIALTPATTFRTSSPAAMFYVNEPLEGVVVPNAPAGKTVNIQLRAWLGGASYETATQLAGESNIIPVSLGGVPAQGAPIPDAVLTGLQGFALVPEPSTVLLGILGAAALIVRRRKPGPAILFGRISG